MANTEERIEQLEREVEKLGRHQRRIGAMLKQIKERQDDTHTRLNGIQQSFMELGDKLSDVLLHTGKQSQMLVEIARDHDTRLNTIEMWKGEIASSRRQPGIRVVDQESNNATLAVDRLVERFETAELDALIYEIFGLSAEPNEFGESKRLKAINMVKRAIQQDKFWSLIQAARARRPGGLWPTDTGPLQ